MRRILLMTLFVLLLSLVTIPAFSAENSEDFQPVTTGMTLNFIYKVEHIDQKDKTWQVKVVKNSFPQTLTLTWIRKEKNGTESTGTRILTDLTNSRNFNPWFKKNETKDTIDSAPWISVQILSELRDSGKAEKFQEGGTGAINWAPATLAVKDNIIFPLLINGKAVAVHAFKLNKGITVWNNRKNPLVLEYEPLGIPLFTSITGWKLISIEY
jgi:hypothetical protein